MMSAFMHHFVQENQYILHELVQHLDGMSLRNLRGTCKGIETILSSNTKFVTKAMHKALRGNQGTMPRHIPFIYGTKHLRHFIFQKLHSSEERYQFTKTIIRQFLLTRQLWEEHSSRNLITKRAAENVFYVTKHWVEKTMSNFNVINRYDKEYSIMPMKKKLINMDTSLHDLHLIASHAEDDLKEAETIIEKRGEIAARGRGAARRGSNIRRQPKWLRNEMMRIQRIENDRNVQQWKYTAAFSNSSLHFLLHELNKIQTDYIQKLETGTLKDTNNPPL